ncbi:MAG: cation:proton antiporter domain-containing protein [Actinomycetota bacterium]
MDVGSLLLRLLAVLVAARVAAEIAERLRQPAVLAEILVGIVLGPSVFHIVGGQEQLQFLGELGAILLLFDVGLHMDLDELRHVGRASLQVATVGVTLPLVLGFFLLRAFGLSSSVALFVAAGITATSVGITARVFAEMQALASIEARTVLGAAVADDVMGLLILTVAVRIGSGEHLTTSTLVTVPILAIGFVVVAAAIGTLVAPALFKHISARARTEGTMTAIGLAFALGLGGAAAAVQLAPIVGAFVAGVALGGSPVRDDLARRMAPVGHVLIPVFFLLIGAETRVQSFADGWVLGAGAALAVVAFIGKLASGIGVKKGRADRLLVGVGMIPRGEVGLIFASLGLQRGILDARTQALLVLVVLVSTVAPPPWIRRRIQRARQRSIDRAIVAEPPGGWLEIGDDEVDLSAEPPAPLGARVGFEAALACSDRRPGPKLLDWLSTTAGGPPPVWDDALRTRFFDVLRHGGVRAWRFLEVSGLLSSALPELEESLSRRMRDPFDLDPAGALRWEALEDVKALIDREPWRSAWTLVGRPQIVLLAALVSSAFSTDGEQAATRLARHIGLEADDQALLEFLVRERNLLPAASARHSFGNEDSVLELAAHVGTLPRAAALYVLASAVVTIPEHREALNELYALVRSALEHPELTGSAATDLLETRRRDIRIALSGFPPDLVERHVREAPRRYLLAMSPASVARHLKLMEPRPHANEVRIAAYPQRARGRWTIDVLMLDRPGALAVLTGAFSLHKVSVVDAFCSTWDNGLLIDVFTVEAPADTDWSVIVASAEQILSRGEALHGEPIEGIVDLDNVASPWHTIVEVRASDRSGLLHRVASALARAGAQIHTATVATVDGVAVDTFLVTGPDGHKLDEDGQRALRIAFEGGTPVRRRNWLRRDNKLVTRT